MQQTPKFARLSHRLDCRLIWILNSAQVAVSIFADYGTRNKGRLVASAAPPEGTLKGWRSQRLDSGWLVSKGAGVRADAGLQENHYCCSTSFNRAALPFNSRK